MNIALAIVAYNRDRALRRLLTSLERSAGHVGERGEIPLIISIDPSDNAKVAELAQSFSWTAGPKRVILHDTHLGLKRHVLACGDLVAEFDAVVVLEDDLAVSPYCWDYIYQAAAFSEAQRDIAQVSLYAHRFNETAGFPFEPALDGFDNFYMRVPSSWGQLWTRRQWQAFRDWLPHYEAAAADCEARLPYNVRHWPDTSWKKLFQSYVIENRKLVLYPRVSLTTNFADAGTHHVGRDNHLQSNLLRYSHPPYRFSPPGEGAIEYDEYCERCDREFLSSVEARFNCPGLVLDLYGARDWSGTGADHVVTAKQLPLPPALSFGTGLRPQEQNLDPMMVDPAGELHLHAITTELRQACGNFGPTEHFSARHFRDQFAVPERIFNRLRRALQGDAPAAGGISRKQAIKALLPGWLKRGIGKLRKLRR